MGLVDNSSPQSQMELAAALTSARKAPEAMNILKAF